MQTLSLPTQYNVYLHMQKQNSYRCYTPPTHTLPINFTEWDISGSYSKYDTRYHVLAFNSLSDRLWRSITVFSCSNMLGVIFKPANLPSGAFGVFCKAIIYMVIVYGVVISCGRSRFVYPTDIQYWENVYWWVLLGGWIYACVTRRRKPCKIRMYISTTQIMCNSMFQTM